MRRKLVIGTLLLVIVGAVAYIGLFVKVENGEWYLEDGDSWLISAFSLDSPEQCQEFAGRHETVAECETRLTQQLQRMELNARREAGNTPVQIYVKIRDEIAGASGTERVEKSARLTACNAEFTGSLEQINACYYKASEEPSE